MYSFSPLSRNGLKSPSLKVTEASFPFQSNFITAANFVHERYLARQLVFQCLYNHQLLGERRAQATMHHARSQMGHPSPARRLRAQSVLRLVRCPYWVRKRGYYSFQLLHLGMLPYLNPGTCPLLRAMLVNSGKSGGRTRDK